MACNPTDPNLLVLVGTNCFRILACADNNWRQFGFSKADTIDVTCATWLSQDRLLAGTTDGKIMVIENGELKNIHWAGDLTILNFKVTDEPGQQLSATNIIDPDVGTLRSGEDYEIRSMLSFSKGFTFAFTIGTVHFFERETPHRYLLILIF